MVSLQQINYILTLVETKHFQRASELCFVTQPTLSMQLKKAEEDLGYKIFDRDTKELSLTSFGEKLIPILRDVNYETLKIQKLVDEMKGSFKEVVRIGLIPTISTYLIPDLFSEWKKMFSGIQIIIKELKSQDLVIALENKQVDLGIMAGPYVANSIRTIPLFTEEIKAYINTDKEDFVFTTMLTESHPWLLSQGNCLRTQMVHFCDLKKNNADEWDYEGGSLDVLLEMVNQNGGYTLIPKEYEKRVRFNQHFIKRIYSPDKNDVPARQVIAMTPERNSKWDLVEKIVRSIQLYYGNQEDVNYQVLSWK